MSSKIESRNRGSKVKGKEKFWGLWDKDNSGKIIINKKNRRMKRLGWDFKGNERVGVKVLEINYREVKLGEEIWKIVFE